jgi:hypothetical protein
MLGGGVWSRAWWGLLSDGGGRRGPGVLFEGFMHTLKRVGAGTSSNVGMPTRRSTGEPRHRGTSRDIRTFEVLRNIPRTAVMVQLGAGEEQ